MFNLQKATICLSLCLLSTSALSKVEIYLSKPEIAFGDTVSLVFESDEEIKEQPNLDSLEKDFKILGKSQSSNVNIVNGNVSKKNKIAYTLYPYQKGNLTIGAIELGNQKFEPISLKVLDAPVKEDIQQTALTPSILFETKINPNEIYEGQVAIYQAKITDESNLQDAELKLPNVNALTFTPLNSDKISQQIQNGKKQRIFERFFILTPLKSGEISLPPAKLSGLIPDFNKKQQPDVMGDFFNFPFDFQLSSRIMQPVYFHSNENQIKILSKPDNWKGWWFPTNNAHLAEEYIMPEDIHTGDIIERKITLTASNIENAKLPLIEHPVNENISIFSNQEERFSDFKNNEIISSEIRTFALSFQKEGKQIIPSVNIKYFNTLTKKEEILTLPEKEINVLPNKKSAAPIKSEITNLPQSPLSQEPIVSQKLTQKNIHPLLLIGIGSLGTLGLMGILYLLFNKKKSLKIEPIEEPEKTKKRKKRKKPLPDLYLD